MTPSRENMRLRKAFTLVELLVSMGIMGMLATVASAGYYAATRSMAVRGVQDATASTIRMAKQRAASTQTRTAVFFRNELLRGGSSYNNEAMRGVVCAVRASGRFSGVREKGTYLVDEFNDFNQSYSVAKNSSDFGTDTMRIYRLPRNPREAPKGTDNTLVYTRVGDVVSAIAGAEYRESLLATSRTAGASETKEPIHAFAFKKASGGKNLDWAPGDVYAIEISVIELPVGYIFGSKLPTSGNPVVYDPVTPIMFGPDGKTQQETRVKVSLCQNIGSTSGRVQVVGEWTTDEVKDED